MAICGNAYRVFCMRHICLWIVFIAFIAFHCLRMKQSGISNLVGDLPSQWFIRSRWCGRLNNCSLSLSLCSVFIVLTRKPSQKLYIYSPFTMRYVMPVGLMKPLPEVTSSLFPFRLNDNSKQIVMLHWPTMLTFLLLWLNCTNIKSMCQYGKRMMAIKKTEYSEIQTGRDCKVEVRDGKLLVCDRKFGSWEYFACFNKNCAMRKLLKLNNRLRIASNSQKLHE